MPLTSEQVAALDRAIGEYAFPAKYFDFAGNRPVCAYDMRAVEASLQHMLTANDPEGVRNGLANVLYWGYAQTGYGRIRVQRFRSRVSAEQLGGFRDLLAAGVIPSLAAIRKLKMPEFSGISFVSKILMFLDPSRYCVLDRQVAKLGNCQGHRALHRLGGGTKIPITSHNEAVYDGWRAECAAIADRYFEGRYPVVDVERGFFHLVQRRDLALGAADLPRRLRWRTKDTFRCTTWSRHAGRAADSKQTPAAFDVT